MGRRNGDDAGSTGHLGTSALALVAPSRAFRPAGVSLYS
jgi:hypothetical protein